MATLLILRRRKQRALRRERVFRDRLNVLESMDDIELINRYRFPRHVIIDIVSKEEGYVTRPTRRVHAIPTYIQVLVTLRFLAKADFFSEVGDLHGISRSSVCRIIHTVCQALNVTLDNIGFPVEATAMRDIKTEFHQIARIPNCVGAVDGTLIPIKGVSGPEEPAYVCRKNFHALNIQAVADARMSAVSAFRRKDLEPSSVECRQPYL